MHRRPCSGARDVNLSCTRDERLAVRLLLASTASLAHPLVRGGRRLQDLRAFKDGRDSQSVFAFETAVSNPGEG